MSQVKSSLGARHTWSPLWILPGQDSYRTRSSVGDVQVKSTHLYHFILTPVQVLCHGTYNINIICGFTFFFPDLT